MDLRRVISTALALAQLAVVGLPPAPPERSTAVHRIDTATRPGRHRAVDAAERWVARAKVWPQRQSPVDDHAQPAEWDAPGLRILTPVIGPPRVREVWRGSYPVLTWAAGRAS